MLCKFRLNKDILLDNSHMLHSNDNSLTYSNKSKEDIEGKIFEAVNGVISAEKLTEYLFPEMEPHIFISHSSRDASLAIRLANSLYEKYQIVCFIDSQLWNHITPAIDKMHRLYCNIVGSSSYDYTKSNNLLAHMHSILSMALMRVMDNSDSVIFLESDNSIHNYINNGTINPYSKINPIKTTETLSPWISSEVCFANTIRMNGHSSRQVVRAAFESYIEKSTANDSMPLIQHKIDLSKFIEINNDAFVEVMGLKKQGQSTIKILDLMYNRFNSSLVF